MLYIHLYYAYIYIRLTDKLYQTKKTTIIIKSTDISLDRQALSTDKLYQTKKTIIIIKSTDISLDRQAFL